ncbi:hypothetical protein MBLNU230_g8382t1 [Neophaeotheca triangularis]
MGYDSDDEDLYGIPKHRQSSFDRSWDSWLRFAYRKSRLLILSAACLIYMIYWLSSDPLPPKVDWSRFAYSQYVTDSHSLCNALMVFESLHRFGSKADRVLLYPEQWDTHISSSRDRDSQLLNLARDKYNAVLQPIQLINAAGHADPGTLQDPSTWDTSITKLRAFELTVYKRVLHLDSDITLFEHLDDLFLLPRTPMAMPRAYWSDAPSNARPLTSLLMLLEPNRKDLKWMLDTLQHWQYDPNLAASYDMELLNSRFGASALVLPHRPYALLTAEFRRHDHSAYLGTPRELQSTTWDADKILNEAKLVHFSDWPLPKPWVMWPQEGLAEMQPSCGGTMEGTCREREIWKALYTDFRKRRKDVCKILSVPAPQWETWKKTVGAGNGTSMPE